MTYRDEENKKLNEELKLRLRTLPDFCRNFFLALNNITLPRTRCAYALDLRLFFDYLTENDPHFVGKSVTEISLDDMGSVKATTISEYLWYIQNYEKTLTPHGKHELTLERKNENCGKSRKLSAVRRLFKFLYSNGYTNNNPAELVDTPKLREKAIIYLEPNETADMLDEIENGTKLTKHQNNYHKKTKERDLAIVTLLLGTGIRVSECVGLNLEDIDLENRMFRVIRKGGKEAILYFGDEVAEALEAYLSIRDEAEVQEGSEDALFLSMQNKRITTRAVQNLVKKYSQNSVSFKKITPHKLRSTFGTQLYKETDDIYLVADVLGHADVNTTRRHYAAQSDENRRRAARTVRLRENK